MPLCAAWGLAVRAAVEQWDWRQYLAGRHAVQALEIYTARSGAPACPPVEFCDPDRVARPPARFGGEKAGGFGEPSPIPSPDDQQKEGQAAALDSQPSEVRQLSDQKEENQTEVGQLFPEIASSSGSVPSTRHWTRKELYTTEALEARERYTGLTLIQRRKVEDALSKGELLDPPAFKQRFGPPGFLKAESSSPAEGAQPKDGNREQSGDQFKVGVHDGSVTARRYLECCTAPFSKETLAEASSLGSDLLLTTGSLEAAVNELQEMRLLRDLLAAAVNGQIEGVSRLHAEYLKEMAELGVPSRRSDLPVRVEAHNHGSVHGYEEELLGKAWKDAAYGAVLLVDPSKPGVAEILESSRVAESPLGRVPKQNPDRTISSEGRPINDMRLQNSKGRSSITPQAPQPKHQSVARQSLWWHARHPGVPQRCAKRDVPRAFKWHFLRPSDVSEFAVKLAGIIIISLVMPFGWVGAPGEFVAWSMAAQAHHRAHAPPHQSGTTSFPMSLNGSWMTGSFLNHLLGTESITRSRVLMRR